MSRVEAIKLYRRLHRVCQTVFHSDPGNLSTAQDKIRSEFTKNRHITDKDEVEHLFGFGHETAEFLRRYVVQLVTTNKPDTLRLVLREENELIDSPPLPSKAVNRNETKE